MAIDYTKEVTNAIINTIRTKCFYGHILQQLTKVYTDSVPTMGVGKESANDLLIKLFINPEYVKFIFKSGDKESSRRKLEGVVEHEVLHLVFSHLTYKFSNKILFNVAADLSVNSYIDRSNLPEGCLFAEDFNLPPKQTLRWYYDNFPKDKLKKMEAFFGEEGSANSHKKWEATEGDKTAEQFIKDIVRKASEISKNSYGNIPGEIMSYLGELFKVQRPKVPWNNVLRRFVASSYETILDYTMRRRSRRFGTRPGTCKEDVLKLAVAIDTSASISDQQLLMFFSEIHWIWKSGAEITICEADTQIVRSYPFRGKFDGSVGGRGGTDLEPVLIETSKKKYNGLIYFSDLEAPRINKIYPIDVLWVLSNNRELDRSEYPYPKGLVIPVGGEV